MTLILVLIAVSGFASGSAILTLSKGNRHRRLHLLLPGVASPLTRSYLVCNFINLCAASFAAHRIEHITGNLVGLLVFLVPLAVFVTGAALHNGLVQADVRH